MSELHITVTKFDVRESKNLPSIEHHHDQYGRMSVVAILTLAFFANPFDVILCGSAGPKI